MVRVIVWSDGVTHVIVTFEPPRTVLSTVMSVIGELILWLFTPVMTSPGRRPAMAAGVPHRDPSTRVPELTGAVLAGMPAFESLGTQLLGAVLGGPHGCWLAFSCCSWIRGSVAVLCAPFGPLGTRTPTNPVVWIWTPPPCWPAMIRFAMDSAWSIGMAKPTLC